MNAKSPVKVYKVVPGRAPEFFREFRSRRAAELFVSGQTSGLYRIESDESSQGEGNSAQANVSQKE